MSGPPESLFEMTLGGERFQLLAEDSRRIRILEIAERVNRRLEEVRLKTDALTLQRAALMTAFQFAYERDEIERQDRLTAEEAKAVTGKIERIISRIDQELDDAGE